MNTITKTTISLSTMALLFLAVTCNANASSTRSQHDIQKRVDACVAETREQAETEDASRIVYWVNELNQKNLAELEVRIEAEVYSGEADELVRQYAVSCVTDAMGGVIEFRLLPTS